MRWVDGGVLVEDSVLAPRPVTGQWLAREFLQSIEPVTFGLIRLRRRSLCAGPIELLRFDEPRIEGGSVAWPIAGGLLAAIATGCLRVLQADGSLQARVEGYRPMLPVPIYRVTQLPLHHALVRMQLLHLRGRRPAAGVPADVSRRAIAGVIDVAVCAAVTLAFARKRRFGVFAAVAAGYHIAAWTASGQTIGGAVMGQRVVAVDGTKPSFLQALLRLALLPVAAFRLRAIHDEAAATDVVAV